jgi:hypothetical protein
MNNKNIELSAIVFAFVGEYSFLYIGDDSDHNNSIRSWKCEVFPLFLSMIFEPSDKTPFSYEYEDDGSIITAFGLKYKTTVGNAINRLETKGIGLERIAEMAACALNCRVDEVLADMRTWEKRKLNEFGQNEADNLVIELGDIRNYTDLADLTDLWMALSKHSSTEQVIFNPTEVLSSWEEQEILETDFLLNARNEMRMKLQILGGLLRFVTQPTPDGIDYVITRLNEMDEDRLLHHIITPLLEKEGYQNVRIVEYHGGGEFGSDTVPMRKCEMGKWFYIGAQAKAERITNSKAPQVWAQCETALSVELIDTLDNIEKKLEFVLLFLGKGATPEALKLLTRNASRNNSVRIFDASEIARLILKHDLIGNLTNVPRGSHQ